ncbi:MAG: bifunctional hydroxymethylpyrimidine kinase/phosphomethylpyrimidine kinase [Terriglobia bacterium]
MSGNSNSQTACPAEPVVLAIGGFDPSGGAGICADLKTFAAHNCYGVAAITALTVQNTQGVSAVYPVTAAELRASVKALVEDGRICAIKVGMLGDRANAEVIKEILSRDSAVPAVLDPVLRSASGYDLLDSEGLSVLRSGLLSLPSVITPNLFEASLLTGMKVENVEDMKAAARKLVETGARAVVVTGGHLDRAIDVYYDGSTFEAFAGERVKPDNTHGTGCTFSSAIASNLALGRQLRDAVVLAKVYVTEAIRKAFATGPGRLPLHHLYRMQQVPRTADHSPALADTEALP